MAGTIIVSSIKTDTDNSFIVRSNTGATLFSVDTTSISIPDGSITSAMIANGTVIAADILDGTITAAKLAPGAALPSQTSNATYYLTSDGTNAIWKAQTALTVANTQITGNIASSQITSNPTLYGNVSVTGVIGVGGATPSTSGSGISFPATQSASSEANTLDDYEEGTWTPALTFSSGSVTYYDQTGQYTKVGNLVTVSFWLRVQAISSPSGTLTITGLPFNSNSIQSRPALLFRARALSGVTGVIGAWLSTNSNYLTVEIQNNGTGSDLNATSLVGNSELDAFFSYHV